MKKLIIIATIISLGMTSLLYGQASVALEWLNKIEKQHKPNDPLAPTTGKYSDIQTYNYWRNQANAAWQRQDYVNAALAIITMLRYDGVAKTAAGTASDYIELGMLCMNIGRNTDAQKVIANAIYIMRNSNTLGKGCEQRAEIFLQKIQKGLNMTFSYKDKCKGGILPYIMEIPNAIQDNYFDEMNARNRAIGAYADSMSKTYRMQGRMQASMAKAYARQEYIRDTGRNFDPTSRPSYDSGARDAWDACKKIYDIFGE